MLFWQYFREIYLQQVHMQTILVIDDSVEVYKPLTSLIRYLGFNCQYATCGKEGLKMVKDLNPDLIILDAMMPDIDGIEVLRTLKSDSKTILIPVVIFSAIFDPHFIAHAMKLGAADYWIKAGIDFAVLKSRLSKLIRVIDC
jgi:two-component system sensor histidine kinase/response regulator